MEPRERLDQLISGFRATQIIRAAADLGIADVLNSGPSDVGPVAAQVGADPALVGRLMRALVALGVLVQDDDGRFVNSALGELLRRDVGGSLRTAALGRSDDRWWTAWGQLPAGMRSGQIPYEMVHGRGLWDDLHDDPPAAARFNALMVAKTSQFVPSLLEHFDFTSARRIVDVGGGSGALIGGLLHMLPEAGGTVFDLKGGLADTPAELARLGVLDRCEVRAGSFFDGVPADGDVYLLRQILHDWPDDQALSILRACRGSMPPTAVLLVIDLLLPDRIRADPLDREKVEFDLHMFVLFGARERSETDMRRLLGSAGFAVDRVLATHPESTVVAVPD